MDQRDEKFRQIKEEYSKFEQHLKDTGIGLVYNTEKGIYGTSSLDHIFRFFKEIHLEKYNHFCDLGCGDGRVVLVASLFTKATGIEFAKELIEEGERIRKQLDIDCELIADDYTKYDFSDYDIIFMNPDHEPKDIDAKLRDEFKGVLFIYNEIFAPSTMKKGKKYWAGQVPIIKYAKKN